ncbi:hypothetical protein GGS24DRAFT_454268 [Hypoxylon argillaceum]|nr:hypothetical protein GGS24DRAFT_454268 [Hypoxylon argillaceum]
MNISRTLTSYSPSTLLYVRASRWVVGTRPSTTVSQLFPPDFKFPQLSLLNSYLRNFPYYELPTHSRSLFIDCISRLVLTIIAPLRSLAEKLNLPIHERDTFTGWDMPPQTNLIIAVSFGLFVPPRLLRAAKYGGLNLHPSLLPDLRGPAPLQHTLLAARPLTGVTLQTLDEHAFDHGVVLAQRPLPVPPSCRTVHALLALVTRPAASMLVAGLRAGLHIPPLRDASWVPGPGAAAAAAASEPPRPLAHAPKITKSDRRVSLAILRACDAEVSAPDPDPLDYSPRVGQQNVFKRRWFHTRDSRGRRRKISMEIMRAAPADDDDGDGDGDSEVSDPADPVPDPGAHARGGTLARRQDVIGPLWFFSRDRHGRKKRIIIELLHEMPGLSLANRPSMIEESLPANAHPQDASSTPSTLHDGTLPYRKYRIPFEDDLEEGDQNPPQAAAGVNLVFWDASHSEPEQTLGQPAQGDGHALCLGNYYVESLKVEGDQAKPARAALHSFIIN